MYLKRRFMKRGRKKEIILAEVVDTNEPVIENCLSAVMSPLGFSRGGKLDHGPLQVPFIPNLL
jgi:hypothetical protein